MTAARCPQIRAMKSDAMKLDFSTSCHGIEPRIEMFIVRYIAGHARDRQQDRARNHAARIADLRAQVADVVVAPVVVDRDQQRRAEAR